MAVEFRNSSLVTGGEGTNATFKLPEGSAVGDLAVVAFQVTPYGAKQIAESMAITGWSADTAVTNAGNFCSRVFWKRVESADLTATFTIAWSGTSEGRYREGTCWTFKGNSSSTLVDGTPTSVEDGFTAEGKAEPVTTAKANSLLVHIMMADGSAEGKEPPAGFTAHAVTKGYPYFSGVVQEKAGESGSKTGKWSEARWLHSHMLAIPIAEEAPAEAPAATTESATGITRTEGTVNATVNPHGQATAYFFEWGTTEGLGSKTSEGSAGEGASGIAKSKTLSGLSPGTRYFFRISATNATGTTHGAIQNFTTEAEGGGEAVTSIAPAPTPSQGVRVVATTEQGAGIGYDLTDQIEGLQWSSTNPGGDESCTFTLKRSWFADSPELGRGNLLQVLDGIDILWRGRVEETDRSGDDTETIGVTAYGLGARLKDSTLREIYVDPDLTKWGSIPAQRIEILGTTWATDMGNQEVRPDSTGNSVLSEIFTHLANTETQKGLVEAWYDASGIELGSIVFVKTHGDYGVGWAETIQAFTDETGTAGVGLNIAGVAGGTLTASEGAVYAAMQFFYGGVFTGDGEWHMDLKLVVVGRHGLSLQGSGVEIGLLVSQLVADAASRADRITVRRLDATSFIVRQSVYSTPTKLEDAIVDMNRFEAHRRTFGTWGPDSPLDGTLDGYFDYREIDDEPSWVVRREDCDSCDLTSEMASLYDEIEVTYTDNSGVPRTVTVTAEVPELNGVPRTAAEDIGKATKAAAEAYGAAFLALTGTFAPARGSLATSRPVLHVARGQLPAHYMRADGSAVQIQGILPASSVFALDLTPNRRTTFPVKRVSVDASSKARPTATVEVDQSADAIAALQARLAQDAEFPSSAAAITR